MNWRDVLEKQNAKEQKYQKNKKNQNHTKSNITDITDITGSGEKIFNILAEIREEATYLFHERLGISNNSELAFEESLNYIINKLEEIVKQ